MRWLHSNAMSEFMKLKSPAVEGVSSDAGRLSETRLMFHSTSSASNRPGPKPTRGSDDSGSASGAGSTALATTGGGGALSRDVAHAPTVSTTIANDTEKGGVAAHRAFLRQKRIL